MSGDGGRVETEEVDEVADAESALARAASTRSRQDRRVRDRHGGRPETPQRARADVFMCANTQIRERHRSPRGPSRICDFDRTHLRLGGGPTFGVGVALVPHGEGRPLVLGTGLAMVLTRTRGRWHAAKELEPAPRRPRRRAADDALRPAAPEGASLQARVTDLANAVVCPRLGRSRRATAVEPAPLAGRRGRSP